MNFLWGSYILIFVYIIIFSIFCKKKLRKKWFLILVSIQLVIVFAIRDIDVGVDLTRYYRSYGEIGNNSFLYIIRNQDYYSSIFFYVIVYVFSHLGISYHTFLGVVGAICVIPSCYFVNKYSEHPYISIIIYLSMGIYSFQFSGLKQSISMVIIMFAFDAVVEQKGKKFYLLVICAMLFHVTAIICLPMFILYNMKYRNWMLIPIVCALIFVYIFRNSIGQTVTVLFSDGEYVGRYESTGIIGTSFIMLILILCYIIIFANREVNRNHTILSYNFKLILFSAFIQIMSSYAYAFTRLNFYYIQLLPFIIPSILDLPGKSNFKNKKALKIMSVIIYIGLFLSSTYMYNVNVINGNNTFNYGIYKENI